MYHKGKHWTLLAGTATLMPRMSELFLDESACVNWLFRFVQVEKHMQIKVICV